MKLYLSNQYQNPQNVHYSTTPTEITSAEQLAQAVALDHVAAEYRDGHRSNDNYIISDCLMMDVDNSETDAPGEWVTLERIQRDLPGVTFYAVTSRNHMKEKKGKAPRPKYHIYFPIPPIDDGALYRAIKEDLKNRLPYYDASAADAARFFYGNRDAQAWYYPGDKTVYDYVITPPISAAPPAPARKDTRDARTGYTPGEDNGLWDLREIVNAISPARLSYIDWVRVGMAMHQYPDKFTLDDWDAWSQQDNRYKPGDCAKRWKGFKDGAGVGAKFLIDTAREQGWQPPVRERQREQQQAQPSERKQEPAQPAPVEFVVRPASTYLTSGAFEADIAYFKAYQDRKTGYKAIDKYLTLYPGLAALGGASSLGKTTFAVNLCDRLLRRGETVLYFTLEQLPIELITKSLARIVSERDPLTRLTNTEIKNGATSKELDAARREYVELSKNCYYITGDFRTTAADIAAYVEQFRADHGGVKPIVIVDYLQLIAPPVGFKGGIREYTDENIKTLKDMQKRNGLFVIMISNFNRSSNLEPVSYESFKETSMIEYTCDYIWGLQLTVLDADNDNFYTVKGPQGGRSPRPVEGKRKLINEAQEQTPKKVEFVSLKNRNGKQFFKAYFNYHPANDLYIETDESGYQMADGADQLPSF